jgi:D-amino-acid dehydrogenase
MARPDSSEDVLIVGAGLVGLACAYSVARAGRRPLVIDAERPGAGASWGNAGWVAFSPPVVAPVPSPEVIPSSLRWLFQRDSPLRIVPTPTAGYLGWLTRFALSCSPSVARSALAATRAFNEGTAALFDDFERTGGVDLEMERLGTLVVYVTGPRFSVQLL